MHRLAYFIFLDHMNNRMKYSTVDQTQHQLNVQGIAICTAKNYLHNCHFVRNYTTLHRVILYTIAITCTWSLLTLLIVSSQLIIIRVHYAICG